jgi:hypothetical protein
MKTYKLIGHGLLAACLALVVAASARAQSDQGDPPARVGRLAEASGAVSFHAADDSQWQAATLNYPVTSGNSFWTEPGAQAAIDVGGSRIYLDSSTELDIGTLDDRSMVASLAQGVVYLRVPDASGGGPYEIDTPRGAVYIRQPGLYEIAAGDMDDPTRVIAFEGAAQLVGQGIDLTVAQGQAVYVSGPGPFSVGSSAARQDGFSQFVQNEERPYVTARRAPGYLSPQETGYQDLGRYGQWQQTPNYGPVWMPRQVAADWAPYRDGRWAYVVPWGWTWIDNAPWGFTPFHYGRWVQYRHHWAWVPGQMAERPVYAPALVSFYGGFDLGGVGIAIGSAVGWVPLGPEEVYVPPYRSSPVYVRNVNITNVRNETTIINVVNNKTVINNYVNYNGTTVVSADAMANSRQIGPEFKKLPQGKWQQHIATVTPMGARAPVVPTYATAGVTPTIGKKIGAAAPPSGFAPDTHLAPGPAVAASQTGSAGRGTNVQPPPLKKTNGTAATSTGTGSSAINMQSGAPGPLVAHHTKVAPQNGAGSANNGNNTGGNATGAQNGTPDPLVTQHATVVPQNGVPQPPLKAGNGAGANGSVRIGNGNSKLNTVPDPADSQHTGTVRQNGTGLPPLLAKRNSAPPTDGNATAPHTPLILDEKTTQPSPSLPPLVKTSNGSTVPFDQGKAPQPACGTADGPAC